MTFTRPAALCPSVEARGAVPRDSRRGRGTGRGFRRVETPGATIVPPLYAASRSFAAFVARKRDPLENEVVAAVAG